MMKRTLRALFLVTALFVTAGLWISASASIPPTPKDWCADEAGFLSGQARAEIDARLSGFEKESGNQVIVYISESLGGEPIEEWCARAFKEWGVGRKGLDNGLALFLFSKDQQLRIEVGYGLEGTFPDAVASRIIREVIVPRLQAGQNDQAVRDGVEAIIAVLGGKASGAVEGATTQPAAPQAGKREGAKWYEILIVALLAIGFLVLLITNPSLAIWLLFEVLFSVIGGGGSGGGGRSSGGGFSGGGGRSGGGGASGRW